MHLRERLRTILVCAALQVGVFCGVPMRPEQIEALMHGLHQQTLAHVIPKEEGEEE